MNCGAKRAWIWQTKQKKNQFSVKSRVWSFRKGKGAQKSDKSDPKSDPTSERLQEDKGSPGTSFGMKSKGVCYYMSTRQGVEVEDEVEKRADENRQSTVVRKAHLAIGVNRQERRPSKIDSEAHTIQGQTICT